VVCFSAIDACACVAFVPFQKTALNCVLIIVGIKHFLSRATNLNPKLPFDDNPLNSEETALAFIIKWYVRTAGLVGILG
jgi:hypothetical protein